MTGSTSSPGGGEGDEGKGKGFWVKNFPMKKKQFDKLRAV